MVYIFIVIYMHLRDFRTCCYTGSFTLVGFEMMSKYYIKYFSKSDGKKIKRPYDPHAEKQHEFIARSGNLCKRYWDESKEGLRTANAPWTIEVRK